MIRRQVIFLLFVGLLVVPLAAQSRDANRNESAAGAIEIALCSNVDVCFAMPLVNNQGKTWLTNGNHAAVTVQHIDATSVVLHREDPDGPSAGLIGDYTGTRTGNWIEGKVVFNWPGHTKVPLNGTWRALLLPTVEVAKSDKEYLQSLRKATAWLVCMDPGDGTCVQSKGLKGLRGLWVLDGERGHSRFLVPEINVNPIFVDHFDEHTIELRTMELWGDFSDLNAQFIGTREGDSMQGTFRFLWPGNHPGSPQTGKWYATKLPLNCKGESNVSSADAMIVAHVASMVADAPGDTQCILIAAKLGDADAEDYAGNDFYAGKGIAKDAKQAAYWYKKSSDQDDISGMIHLANLYEKGEGVPKDLLMSNYLKNNAQYLYRESHPQGIHNGVDFARNVVGLMRDISSGDIDKDPLEMTVKHQKRVLQLMGGGSSRVEAERTAYDEDQAAADPPKAVECQYDHTSDVGQSVGQRQINDERRRAQYNSCVDHTNDAWREARDRRVNYLQCVVDNVDSNVIETKCRYQP